MNSPTTKGEARNLPQLIGCFISDAILSSEEFGELDTKIEKPVQAETKPGYEIFLVSNTVDHTHFILRPPI